MSAMTRPQAFGLRSIELNQLSDLQPLYQPAFLLWLERSPGVWDRAGERLEIGRRSDGLLLARDKSGKRQPLVDLLSGGWSKLEPPPGPLGMRPVTLSGRLIALWLEPEVARQFAYTMFVPTGTQILLEKIETVIHETPLDERERKWLAWWQHHAEQAAEGMTRGDLAEHQRLFECFQNDVD